MVILLLNFPSSPYKRVKMKVVIVEDEQMASDRLASLLKECDASIEVVAKLDSVKNSIKWFGNHPQPDLVFFDIQLGDGLSFEIFEQAEVNCPVVFTTAYDAYAIKAFTVNSMAYLLKPVKKEELKNAIDKYKESPYNKKSNENVPALIDYDRIQKLLLNQFKKRFLIKTGLHIRSIETEDILYFYSLEKASYLQSKSGKTHLLDYSLEQLEELVDPQNFFRINRKYIVSISSIEDVITLSNYRLKLKLLNCQDDEILVSRDSMQEFKLWLDR
jgi:two-component system, LytTR family, response regulator